MERDHFDEVINKNRLMEISNTTLMNTQIDSKSLFIYCREYCVGGSESQCENPNLTICAQ